MNSKTFCFNKTIFKKNVTHLWPLWAAYLLVLLVLLPIKLCVMLKQLESYGYMDNSGNMQEAKNYLALGSVIKTGLEPMLIFGFAAAVALVAFSYLYNARSANMMHSLPVTRLELFATNYLSGLLSMIIPELITFMVAVLTCVANQVSCMQYMFLWLLYVMAMTFFAYSLAVCVAMFTGQAFAMPVYYFIVNYLYVGCLYIVCALIALVSYGVTEFWNPGKTCILSPIYYIRNNARARVVYDDKTGYAVGISMKGGGLLAIYALAAVLIVIVAYRIYRRRQIETAGALISIGIVRPVFRWGVAVCGGVGITLLVIGTLAEYYPINIFAGIVICIIVFGFLCFFVAEMLLKKSFRVFRKMRLFEWAGFTVIALVAAGLFEMDVFGVERYLPAADEIEGAFVYLDYPIYLEPEEIPRLLELHQTVIDSKEEYLRQKKEDAENCCDAVLTYYLKDGSKVERSYPLPMTETSLEDVTEPVGQILAWEKDAENMSRQILGYHYESNQYFSCYVERCTEDGRTDQYTLDEREMKEIMTALEKDIQKGNFDTYYISSSSKEEEQFYYNGICLQYVNKDGYYDIWDYYWNYRDYQSNGNGDSAVVRTSTYIMIGPKCIYTEAKLKQLGIIDGTWKLMLYDDFWEMMEENGML